MLSVGRLGGRVIACFVHEHALILYVFLNGDEPGGGDSVLTVRSIPRLFPCSMLTEAAVLHLLVCDIDSRTFM